MEIGYWGTEAAPGAEIPGTFGREAGVSPIGNTLENGRCRVVVGGDFPEDRIPRQRQRSKKVTKEKSSLLQNG